VITGSSAFADDDSSSETAPCARSSSTPKPPASIRARAIAWSKSAIHGLSAEFLRDKPRFLDIADEFLAFIGDAPLVIHNASFDHGFLCAELTRIERALIARDRLVDTLMIARRRLSAGTYNLDALCKHYGIDNSRRTKHGALLDAEILAEVYLELIGGRQATLGLAETAVSRGAAGNGRARLRQRPAPLMPRVTDEERAAHREFVATLGEEAVWLRYRPV
jgi:DNA polymerase-3 subunit epsilon